MGKIKHESFLVVAVTEKQSFGIATFYVTPELNNLGEQREKAKNLTYESRLRYGCAELLHNIGNKVEDLTHLTI